MREKSLLRLLARDLVPPVLLRLFEQCMRHSGYSGNFASWDEARRSSTGYDSSMILAKVKDAMLKVKKGEAACERDSVLFDEVQYSWPLLAGILWVASHSGGLSVLDFGGSLGSTYFQNRRFLSHISGLSWSIVEQENFVQCGKEFFEDENLRFYETVEECLGAECPQLLLLSSVLPYLEHPYTLLDEVIGRKFPFIILDRTPLIEGERDRLTVQRVPAEIYPASYPAWMLGRERLLSRFAADYDLVAEFDALAGEIDLGGERARDKGFIFSLKESGGR